MVDTIRRLERGYFREDVPEFGPGDTVRAQVKVVEGSRERLQAFEGVVIRRRGGGINENFTIRRIASHGIGVERTFLIHSPRVDRIEVLRHGRVRRAKLYYLRGRQGKAARIRERRRPANSSLRGPLKLEDLTATAVQPQAVEDVTITTASEQVEAVEPVEMVATSDGTEVTEPVEAGDASETADGDQATRAQG